MYKQAQAALQEHFMEKQAFEAQKVVGMLRDRLSKLRSLPGTKDQAKALEQHIKNLERMDTPSVANAKGVFKPVKGGTGNASSMVPNVRAEMEAALKLTRASEDAAGKGLVSAAKDDAARKAALERLNTMYGGANPEKLIGTDRIMQRMSAMANKQPMLAGMDPNNRKWLNRGLLVGGGALGGGMLGSAMSSDPRADNGQYA